VKGRVEWATEWWPTEAVKGETEETKGAAETTEGVAAAPRLKETAPAGDE
jgi:hypothetical protein